MTDAQELEEIAGQQRYMEVSMWMKSVMGQLLELTRTMPQDNVAEELSVRAVRRYHTWKLACVCSVSSHGGPLKQIDAQQGVSEVVIDDADKTGWRHPYLADGGPAAYSSGTRGNVSVHVSLETIRD